jgi:hypothetical protein
LKVPPPTPQSSPKQTTRIQYPETAKLSIIIQAYPDRYLFSIIDASGALVPVGQVPASILVRERPYDSYFIGTFLGLYSCGVDGIATSTPAVFSDVSWKGIRAGGK